MNKQVLKEVKIAYADCLDQSEKSYKIRQLHFRASNSVSPAEAKEILEKCNVYYNEFEPNILDKFPPDCQVSIAREGSVCLYINGKNLPSAREVLADEKDKINNEVRYWWD